MGNPLAVNARTNEMDSPKDEIVPGWHNCWGGKFGNLEPSEWLAERWLHSPAVAADLPRRLPQDIDGQVLRCSPNSDGVRQMANNKPAFLFDLDGTLVDSVYQHVLAWRAALEAVGIELAVWRIHRRIGMSGGLFINALLRETESDVTVDQVERIQTLHAEAYRDLAGQVRPLPGAQRLLQTLTAAAVPWAIATSGRWAVAQPVLDMLGVPERVPIVTRDQVLYAKPDPDLFLAAAERLGVPIETSVVVGDSIWDLLAARRARALSVGLLSGGYGRAELETAGAYRVYDDPADLLIHLDEVGVRGAS